MRISYLGLLLAPLLVETSQTQTPFSTQLAIDGAAIKLADDLINAGVDSLEDLINDTTTLWNEDVQKVADIVDEFEHEMQQDISECPIAIQDFPCQQSPIPQERPTGERAPIDRPRLRDIKLMAAIGDSVTAGLFLHGTKASLLKVVLRQPVEDRPFSFTIGGDINALTLGTLFKRFSPALEGLPTTRTRAFTASDEIAEGEFDFGRSMAVYSDFVDQARVFVDRLKSDTYQKFRGEWKMVNILGGANNLCRFCESANFTVGDESSFDLESRPDQVARRLNELISYIVDNTPRDDRGVKRIFINVLTFFQKISPVYHIGKDRLWCKKVQQIANLCRCMYMDDDRRDALDKLAASYGPALREVVKKWQMRTQEGGDLAGKGVKVSIIRTIESVDLFDLGYPFLSKADCFHPNECSTRMIAFKAFQAMTLEGNLDEKKWYQRDVQWKSCADYENAELLERL